MIHSKKCFKCQAVKPLQDFYKHSGMADGHLNKCKECTKNDANKHRLENLERIREYDKERSKRPERIKKNLQINRAWRQADLRRTKCHNAVARAVRKGILLPKPCERCGNENSLAHHENYDNPLDVVWLCQPCHKKRHIEMLDLK